MRVDILNKELFRKTLKHIFPELQIPKFGGISIDSRKIQKGDIFLAIKGEHDDGHNYIIQAKQAGASIVILEKHVDISLPIAQVQSARKFLTDLATAYRRNLTCSFIGITGTNGKTTTKDLLHHVLSVSMTVMSTRGNFNSTIGVPLSIFECSEMAEVAIIEMGASKPDEIEFICNIVQPNMGIITNIYDAHLKYFRNIDNVAKTKSALFSSLPINGTAFINQDDAFIPKMAVSCNRVKYSFPRSADYQGEWSSDSLSIIINNTKIKLPTPSKVMGMNALAVFAIASHLGMDAQSIKGQIESFQTPTGRGDVINIQDIIVINDSYNANLESARFGINALISLYKENRKIAVIGDMLELGEMEKECHQILGKYLSEKKVDAVFAFGELTQHTIKAMNGAAMFHHFYDDKASLLKDLKEFLMSGDIIYIKGSRRMKMEDIITGLQV